MPAFGIEFHNGPPIGIYITSMSPAGTLLILDVLDYLGSGDGIFRFLPLARFTDTGNTDIGKEPAAK